MIRVLFFIPYGGECFEFGIFFILLFFCHTVIHWLRTINKLRLCIQVSASSFVLAWSKCFPPGFAGLVSQEIAFRFRLG